MKKTNAKQPVTASKRESFRIRCRRGPGLTNEQFDELVARYLSKVCSGLMCTMISDWEEEKHGYFWDTECWSVGSYISPPPGRVTDSLHDYACQYLREHGLSYTGIDISAYVTFKTEINEY